LPCSTSTQSSTAQRNNKQIKRKQNSTNRKVIISLSLPSTMAGNSRSFQILGVLITSSKLGRCAGHRTSESSSSISLNDINTLSCRQGGIIMLFIVRCALDSSVILLAKICKKSTKQLLRERRVIFTHCLFGKSAEWVIYHDSLVMTGWEHMREATVVHPKWLVEVVPTFFKVAD
jgi:hypothetical protein